VDVTDKLPGLKTISGVSKWIVYCDSEGNEPSFTVRLDGIDDFG
jgi:hypothetical protein